MQLAMLRAPQRNSIRYHVGCNGPQSLDNLSRLVEATHVRVASGKMAMKRLVL
jgi:hypothetical protein